MTLKKKDIAKNIEIAKRICDLYATNKWTIESAIEAQGIASSTFYDWLEKNGEIVELYKKAKEEKRQANRKEIKELAETALRRKLTVTEIEETHTEGKLGPDGKPVITKKRVVKKQIEPDTTAIIFALKNTDPENWTEKQHIDHTILNMDKIELTIKRRTDSENNDEFIEK